ncbi:MAG TPA: zinc ABC transporter substrate-binding protein [Candidatus Paceibacterota bacterium]|nr:zinc ABC transporter substrate-binding protein [Candidatus Paceibacterota bacterium]
MNKTFLILAAAAAVVIVAILGFFVLCRDACHSVPATTGELSVVAAENFWGSLVSQLGGSHVRVFTIVSDPNADPHEYESNTADARAVATANYVIENGAGYDSWADKLLGASPDPNRKVMNVAALLGKQEGDNPHFWYSPAYVNQVVARMEQDLIALDPANASYYEAQYKTLQASLAQYQNRIVSVKQQFGGAKIAATEDIVAYLADAAGLDLVSPPAFIQAVAEGNDPPAASIVEFENQLKGGGIRALVYNEQTVTPLTESVKKIAADQGIPAIGVTETIQPPDVPFEDWMNAELLALQNALNVKILGQ